MTEDLEARVRRGLAARADSITVRSREDEILDVGRANPQRRRPWLVAAAIIAVLALGVVTWAMARDADDPVEIGPADAGQTDDPDLSMDDEFALAMEEWDLIVWMSPNANAAEQVLVREALKVPLVEHSQFFDKNATYAELQRLFADKPEMVEVVTPDSLPSSYRTVLGGGGASDAAVELANSLATLPGVRDVVRGPYVPDPFLSDP